MSTRKKLLIPATLAVAIIGGASALTGCPNENPNNEPNCAYVCNSDAAVALSEEDAGPDPYHQGFTTDGGESCYQTFC